MPPSRRPGIAPIVLALTVTAVLALGSCASGAPPPVSDVQAQSGEENPGSPLEVAVRERLVTLSGDYAVAVRELTGEQRQLSIRGAEPREPASVIKLFAAYAALDRVDRGALSLDDAVRSGVSVDDCLRAMIVISDNNCHWELVDLLGEQSLRAQFAREG